jgi:hypothetical protein
MISLLVSVAAGGVVVGLVVGVTGLFLVRRAAPSWAESTSTAAGASIQRPIPLVEDFSPDGRKRSEAA